jgi:hypothetical protein
MTCPCTFSPSLNFSAYPLLNCDAAGALSADDLKVDVARGTAFEESVDAHVMLVMGREETYAAHQPRGQHGETLDQWQD